MSRDLPSGTVTFLFTDVEGSTRLLHELGPSGYAEALAEHRRALRAAFGHYGGIEVDTQGDAFFVAFPQAQAAVDAAAAMVDELEPTQIRVRIGIHSGTPHVTSEGYVGPDVNKGARIAAAGHGGQVLISKETRELVDADVTDLGEHRVKDFDQPVWIYQLGTQRFPPLKTISNTNLPRPASSFVGRDAELAAVVERVRDGVRLVTLTGPGGTGKTRLSIEAGAELVPEFRNGVFWVGLATLRDPGLVTDEIAQTLGAKDGLADHIGDKQMLLVLDNFEQVVGAAPELSRLLQTCPNLSVLVTSRELLRVSGEVEFAVPPLAATEAVELFCARAGLEPSDSVAELCRRLDHLPLAVELAAARTKVLSPAKILDRLSARLDLLKGGRDADPRQATLRATIEWSHDLLTDGDKELFARLAVFRGGATLEAAEDVCDADLDTLQSLVDKSLVRHSDERFWMLETIRDFAVERLDESPEGDDLRRRHAEHFLALAERAHGDSVVSAPDPDWFPRVEAELDNFRADLDWAVATGEAEMEARLIGAIAPYWVAVGYAEETRERLSGAAARYTRRDPVRAQVVTQLGDVVSQSGLDREGLSYLYEALDISRELGDELAEAAVLEIIGYCHVALEDLGSAEDALERSLMLRRAAALPELEGRSLAGLCQVLIARGDLRRLESAARELLDLAGPQEATSHYARRTAQSGLHYLADVVLVRGDYAEAERRYIQAFEHARKSQLHAFAASELVGLAMSVAGQGHYERAVRLASTAYQRFEDLGIWPTAPFWDRLQELFIGGARVALGESRAAEIERAARTVEFGDVATEVLGSRASE